MKIYPPEAKNRVYLILFFVFLSSKIIAQIPNCATAMLPVDGGTLANPSTPFTWNAPGGTVSGYRIYLGTSSAANELVNGTTVTGTTYTYSGSLSCGTNYYWKVVPYNGSGSASGCSVQSFTILAAGNPALFPVGTWNAYCYASANWTNYSGFYTSSGMDFDSRNSWTTSLSPSTASTYQGCSVPNDNHSVIYKRQGFTPGTYSLNILNDDACYLYLNGQLIYSKAAWTSTFVNNVWTGNLDGSSQLEFRWSEGSGSSNGAITFVTTTPPAFAPGSVAGDQTLCPGSDPLAFTSIVAGSGACGSVTYQWQQDANCSGNWIDILGATSATYDVPSGITQTTCYRRAALDFNCNRREYSNTITLNITSQQQGNPSVFPLNTWNGYVYDFTATGYTASDDSWTDYKGYFTYPGVSSADPSFNTNTFFTSANVPSTGPSYAGCQVGSVLSGVQFKRKGFPSGTYQLDFNSDDAGFLYVNGTLIYSRNYCCNVVSNVWTGNLDANSTIEYRYKNNQGGALGSLKFTLVTPSPLIAGTVSSSSSNVICSGDTPPAFTSSAPASGGCTLSNYQWQSNTGSGWNDISGATGLTYAPTNVLVTTSYRRNITDICGTVSSSNVLTLTVGIPTLQSNTIFGDNMWYGYVFDFTSAGYTSQDNGWTDYRGYFSYNGLSVSTSSLYGNTIAPSYAPGYEGCQVSNSLSGVQLKRQGFPAGTYQIDFNSDDAGYLYINGVLVYGRTGCCTSVPNVWTGNLDANSKIDFRYKNGGGNGFGTLTFTLVSPTSSIDPGSIANTNSSTVCSGNSLPPFTSLTNATSGCYVYYQWESNTGSGWSNISGATSSTYTASNITTNTSYRRKATDACGASAYSNTIAVTVGANASVTPVFGNNVWNAYVYDFGAGNPTGNGAFTINNTGWTNNSGSFQMSGISTSNPGFNSNSVYNSSNPPSYATGYQGCQVGSTLNGVIFKRQGFTTGTYQIDFTSDDPGFLYVNGVLVSSRLGNGTNTNAWTGNLNASSTVEFRYKNNLGVGQAIVSFTAVSSTAPLTPGVIAADQAICQGAVPATFTAPTAATSGCFITYQWQTASAATGPWTDIAGATNPTYTSTALTQTKYFRRVVTDGCGGNDVSNIVTVNIAPLPSSAGSITGALTFCSGQAGVAYSIPDVQNATGYNWSLPTGATIASGAGTSSISVNFGTVSGTITVVPTNGCGNGSAASKSVLVSNVPAAAGAFTASTSTVCSGQAGVVYTIAAVSGATSYNWSVPSGATITSASNTNSITVTFGSTTGSVTVTPVNGCGNGASRSVTVTVNTAPAAAATISGLSGVCRGQTNVAYSIPAVTGATSYSWTLPTGVTITSGSGTRSVVVNYTGSSVSGNIKVTPVNTCGNGSASTLAVTVSTSIPSAAGTITGTSSACAGTTGVVYSIAAVSNATGYNWVVPSGTTITAGLNTNSITVNLGSVSGNITVTPSNACGNGTASPAFAVNINPFPSTAGVITGSGSVCAGAIGLTYSIPAVTNATGYNWTVPSGAVITSGTNTRSITVTMGTASGNVSVTPTNACGNGTGNSLSVNVTNIPSAAGSISGLSSVCKNTTGLIYSIASVTGATNYTWTVPSGAVITSGAGTNSITVTMGTIGGNVAVTPSNACFSGAASSFSVAVTNSGPAAAGIISGPGAICGNASGVSYSVTPVSGATSYSWSVPVGASIVSGAGTNIITVNFGDNAGNISVTPVNVCGSGSPSSLGISINLGPGAVGAITGTSVICKGQTSVNYNIANVANASSYSWSVPEGAIITSGDGTPSILVSYENVSVSNGSVSVSAMNSCGSTSNNLTIAIDQACKLNWVGATSIDWSTASNWDYGFVPTKDNDVVIPTNQTNNPTLSNTAFCRTIVNNGTLTLGTNTINVYGDFNNNGEVKSVSGSVFAMKGVTEQKIKGISSLYNLTIDNGTGVEIKSAMTLAGKLLLVNGTLISNGYLKVDIDNGGNIGYNSGDKGNVSGNITVFRAVKSTKTHYISCPLNDVPVSDLADNAQVINPATGKTRLFKSNFSTQNWDGITDLKSLFSPNSAYSMFFPAATTIDFTGSYNHGASYSTPSYPNTELKYIFVGNPYPTTLDWDNDAGWTKNNINDAVYYWNPVTNGYASYISGFGTNGAVRYIPAMNSFFVATTGTGGTASLAINNNARSEKRAALWRVGNEESIRIKVLAGSLSDETIIRWNDMGTADFDKSLDAYKMLNSGSTPNIYTEFGSTKYSINALDNPYVYTTIPISVGVPADGAYSLNISNSDPTLNYVLVDKKLGTLNPVDGQDYVFSALKADATDRFELKLSSDVITSVQKIKNVAGLKISSSTGGFNISSESFAGKNATVEVFDLKGNKISVVSSLVINSGNNFVPLSLANGMYVVKVNVENVSYVDQITLLK